MLSDLQLQPILERHRTVLCIYGSNQGEYSSIAQRAIAVTKAFDPDTLVVDVGRNRALRHSIQAYSGWELFPQLFVFGEFIGGAMVLTEFFCSGEFERLCRHHGVSIPRDRKFSRVQQPPVVWKFSLSSRLGILAGAAADGSIYLWERLPGGRPRQFKVSDGWINSVCVSHDAATIYAGLTDGSIRVLEVHSGKEIGRLEGHWRWVNDLVLSRDGSVLWSASADRRLIRWNLERAEQAGSIEAHAHCIWCIELTESEEQVLSGAADGTVAVWNAATLGAIAHSAVHKNCVTALCRAASETGVWSGSYDGTIRLLAQDASEIDCFRSHHERVWDITLVGSSGLVASSSGDGTVRVWEPRTKKEIQTFEFNDMPIALQGLERETWLAVGHASGQVSWLSV